ncbi:unnamed protein product [Timema podura]|uniref:Transmembrane protein 199 n=1 Tax=Timema podura TaxID=61482 RepID=A0ABN7PK41_TIMPD|nr:unnamed protein product [Timema podura]
MEVLKLHEHPHLVEQCCELINREWPRSEVARIEIVPSRSLQDVISRTCHITEATPRNISAVITQGDVNLTVSDIKWLHQRLGVEHGASFHELLVGCELRLPQPPVTPRSPELEARIQRLRHEQDARDYRAMTKNVDSVRIREPEDTLAYQMKQINRQLIAVGQFVVSVAAGFAFGFLGVELIVGNLDFGFRLLLGVMCALVIALAEIYFLAKKLSEDLFPPTPVKLASHPN